MKQSSAVSGFLFALTTAIFWGSLPLALKQVVQIMDSITIVWYRFVVAIIGLHLILAWLKKLPKFRQVVFGRHRWLFLFAGIALGINFVLYNSALKYISPDVSQIISQLSPFFMMIASALVLKERITVVQKIGASLLILGLLIFFNQRLIELLTSLTGYTIGVLLGVAAASVWVIYGIIQKILLRSFNSQQVLLVCYVLSGIMMTPMATPKQIVNLPWFELCCLAYACLNTLIAYGSFAEALNRWDVAKVSAVITLTPLFTILFSHLAHLIAPQIFPYPNLNSLAYIGACVVVSGTLFSVVGHRLVPKRWQKH